MMSGIVKAAADHLGTFLPSPRSAGHRIGELVDLVNRLNQGGKTLPGEEQWNLVSEIADIAAEYPFHFYPMRGVDVSPEYKGFMTFQLVSVKQDRGSIQVCDVLNSVRILLEHGELWRVKFCRNCRSYFRASRRKSAWCSAICKKKWRENNQAFLERRANDAFEKYWDDQTAHKTGRALREAQARRTRAEARRKAKRAQ